jgi:hypothetical protein
LANASGGLSGADIQTIALSARRQAVLEGHPIDTGAVAWAAYEASVGRPTPPPRGHLIPSGMGFDSWGIPNRRLI